MPKSKVFILLLSACAFLFCACTSQKVTSKRSLENSQLESMTVQDLVGQMVVCGFSGTELTDDFADFLRTYKVGGVILFAGNMRTLQQTRKLCSDIQKVVTETTGFPAFICTDQEGGAICRLPKKDFLPLPGAYEIASFKNPNLVFQAGKLTAKELLLCGINVDFAPVADINSNPKNPIIGKRAYGSTAEDVILYSGKMAQGLLSEGLLCAVKHFPGHGDTDTDSHLGLPSVNKSYEQLLDFELKPFKAAVDLGVPIVMTAHILFPKIDDTYPATMSHKILTDILRGDLGFAGLIITDDLEMAAIKKHYGLVDGAMAAVNAGADLLCLSVFSEGGSEICDALALSVDRKRLEQSALRIIGAKEKLADLPLANQNLLKSLNSDMKKIRNGKLLDS